MIKASDITPGVSKHNVLISVNALVDLDVGMYKLIRDEYLDPSVFNQDFLLKASIMEYIQTSYYRTEDNLLYPISIIDDHELLDEYCAQFIKTEYNTIYDKATYTDILEMIRLFIASKEANITIYYYGDYVKSQLENDIKDGTLPSKISLLDAKELKSPSVINKFDQIYIRSIYELDEFALKGLESPKNFYISNFGPNFDSKGNLKRTTSLKIIQMGQLMHNILIYTLYNQENVAIPTKGDNI